MLFTSSSSSSNTGCGFEYVTTIDRSFEVYCLGSPGSGNPDSLFAIAVIPGDALPGGVAYAYADQFAGTAGPFTPTNAYNPGGTVLITRVDVGIDDVTFRGINPADIAGGMVQVASGYGSLRRDSKGLKFWRRKRDSNPRASHPANGFQDRRLQPLGHSSVVPLYRSRPAAALMPRRGPTASHPAWH